MSNNERFRQGQKQLNDLRNRAIRNTLLFLLIVIGGIAFFVNSISSDSEDDIVTNNQEVENEQNDNSGNESSNTCSICGNSFSGNGYEEQMDGSWIELEDVYQGQICSPSCGEKHTDKMNNIGRKYGVDLENESGEGPCQRCSGSYVDGFCNICGGASPERVNQSIQNRADCEMCQGNKYIDGYDGLEVCSVCNGSGKQTY